ncbi:deoxyribodipyrimidine photolyase [Tenacibaculum holothuriorum]|uniref:Deoxyribodipyrimidine photolyase n=1 Tax=Tenacibaculum holothuriorum TaxID=1635173 RepID=A0A1Y2PCP8_9FLAO|nr:deoxyribodipyrimidine photo-lyase [Tenacibaculum holothuriorum]OSY87791.1 deoxyribodipyrimidine photolyase [Tenacibaculum holothuriorum]
MEDRIVVFWFRRDLRLHDNTGLSKALQSGYKVLPIFIFDDNILDGLPKNDARITFIYDSLKAVNNELIKEDTNLLIQKGSPLKVWKEIIAKFSVAEVYFNHDYEPYGIKRDQEIRAYLTSKNIVCNTFKDQVIFEKNEVLKKDGTPYTVFTPYKSKWLQLFNRDIHTQEQVTEVYFKNFIKNHTDFPELSNLGFNRSKITVKPYSLLSLSRYEETRNFPFKDTTSYLSPYLRFGIVSIRKMVTFALQTNETFLSELIWREFFMQILYHYPKVLTESFKKKYDVIPWRNNIEEFNKWCNGETGYPLVDAGMRELNQTGYMHNRVRMVVASFLCKHLLIDWRWGEAYFAKKLLDFELASNNGNWQWAAGTGCDAAPYFRVFNPTEQLKKFDKELKYTQKWVTNLNEFSYPPPMVDHKLARERAINTYKKALQ